MDGDVAGKTALILCGKGNNGGDGAALARAMSREGCTVASFSSASSPRLQETRAPISNPSAAWRVLRPVV